MAIFKKKFNLLDHYAFPGFRPVQHILGVFGDPLARVITYVRTRKKPVCSKCGALQNGWYDRTVRRVRDLPCADTRIYLELEIRRVDCKKCGTLGVEHLDFIATNPHYTKRFALLVGKRCNSETIKDVANDLHLDWHAVKDMDMQYMRAQIALAGMPQPKWVGLDEISVKKKPKLIYRIVASDLGRRRAIWFGGQDRTRESMAEFYDWLGSKKSARIELIVMDMWEPFYTVAKKKAAQAGILFDKFHIVSHLQDALNTVRISEYKRLTGTGRKFIKGQKYTLLSNRENLTMGGKRSLKTLLDANKRINIAYVLKESFDQLWSYKTPAGARRFFEHWRARLKWQRLKPYESFARLVDKHWDGIVTYCKLDSRIPLGFVEGFNNKIRTIQRRAYGIKDEQYLRLKILSCMLPLLKTVKFNT